ncbi:MAG: PIN domain-containing protein [Candidatus Humimicrobiaceae bacterium]
MKPKFIFDTSAVITYFSEEDEVEIVNDLFLSSKRNEIDILIPFTVLVEFYYINFKRAGEDAANQRHAYLNNFPAIFIKQISEPYLIQAGRLKAKYPISFADAMIAAYSILEDATLVHKDPEFLSLEKEIKLQTLPLKLNL